MAEKRKRGQESSNVKFDNFTCENEECIITRTPIDKNDETGKFVQIGNNCYDKVALISAIDMQMDQRKTVDNQNDSYKIRDPGTSKIMSREDLVALGIDPDEGSIERKRRREGRAAEEWRLPEARPLTERGRAAQSWENVRVNEARPLTDRERARVTEREREQRAQRARDGRLPEDEEWEDGRFTEEQRAQQQRAREREQQLARESEQRARDREQSAREARFARDIIARRHAEAYDRQRYFLNTPRDISQIPIYRPQAPIRPPSTRPVVAGLEDLDDEESDDEDETGGGLRPRKRTRRTNQQKRTRRKKQQKRTRRKIQKSNRRR